MAIYKLAPEAEEDMGRIWLHGLKEFGEEQADRYFLGFFDKFHMIAEHPYHYEAVDHLREEYRRCVYENTDSIYYKIIEGGVEIVRILGQQDHNTKL